MMAEVVYNCTRVQLLLPLCQRVTLLHILIETHNQDTKPGRDTKLHKTSELCPCLSKQTNSKFAR